MITKTLNVALCNGRHQIPQAIDGSIFGNTIADVTAVDALEKEASSIVFDKAYNIGAVKVVGYDIVAGQRVEVMAIDKLHVNLYVTGLTVALIAFLNAMRDENVTITLWHYNNATGDYYPQEVK